MRNLIILLFLIISLDVFGAMDETRCGDAIVAAIKIKNPSITGAGETDLKDYWKIICKEIILEITNNMEITTTVPVIGVQTGITTINAVGTDSSIQ